MRIAFVAPFGLRAKGTTRARALPLARALAAHGCSTALFVPPYDSAEDSGRSWREADVEVLNLQLPRSGVRMGVIAHLRLARRLLSAVRCWAPDVVHVFKPKGPSGLVGAATWLMGQGQSSRIHKASFWGWRPALVVDSDDWEGPGGWNDDPRAGYSALERHFFTWQERYGLTHADAWTVTSVCLRDRAVQFGADPDRVYVLPNGLAANGVPLSAETRLTDADDRRRPSFVSDPPSAVLYTRFAGVRAQDVAAIWNRVRESIPTARLMVVGHGLAGEEETLRNVPGVDVCGWIESDELPTRFASARLALVPWVDSPSNRARHSAKVLELMQAGLPIVGFAVGELASTVGDTGALVEPGDDAAFARAIVALMGDPELTQRLGAAARDRVLGRFTWERLAAIAIEAYRSAWAI
jgi:glycosyltransferase involved in cell wall biosynthesis